MPFLLVIYWNRASISNALHFKTFTYNYIWATNFDLSGHVTSLGTGLFDTPGAISYRCSIITESFCLTIFDIMGPKHIRITTLTFQGHVTSSIT